MLADTLTALGIYGFVAALLGLSAWLLWYGQ